MSLEKLLKKISKRNCGSDFSRLCCDESCNLYDDCEKAYELSKDEE